MCAVAAAAPPAFRAEWLQPYLTQGPAAEGRRLLEAGAAPRAVPLLRRHLVKRPSGGEQLQVRFLLAHALLRTKTWDEAATLFGALVTDYPLLADYCRTHGAQALLRGGKPAAAERLAASVAAAAVLKPEAERLRADALRALGRHGEGAAIWALVLRRQGGGALAAKAHFRIAEALEGDVAKGGVAAAAASRAEALEHYKQVTIKGPLSTLRPDAERRLAALAPLVPQGPAKARLDPAQRFAQALGYFQAQRNPESEAAFAVVLREQQLGPALRCKASFYRAKSVFKQRQRARAAPLYDEAARACRAAQDSELVVKALYDGGRGLLADKQQAAAIARFRTIEREFPKHSYADDARLWVAEAQESLQQPAAVTRTLSTLPSVYPAGDMAHEALWRLARLAYGARKLDAALAYLERSLTELGRPRYYYALGQAQYWKARILEQRGRPADARRSYEQCIREYPLSYYALLALNRLRERHGALYAKLERELIAAAGRDAGRWSFGPRELYAHPAFARGVELARLGFGAEAARELALAGLRTNKGGESAWLAAVLYDRAGLWHLSHQVPRSVDTAYKRSYPLGEEYRRWAIAYPRAYWSLVRENARRAAIPEALVLSIMREESGFNTTTESYANAVGLMQLILPTARTAGSAHRLQVTRELLHDPAVNIKLGATYLGFLHRTFGRTIPLAVAGYNAGEGAAYRWLRQLGQVPLDELIERIPYDQTRRYTKRVLSTLFTYAVLYGVGPARVPHLPQRLPRVQPAAFGKQ